MKQQSTPPAGIAAPEAERNLLSSLIQNPMALDSLPDLSALDFYDANHRAVCVALLELRKKDLRPDRVLINEQIAKNFIDAGKDRPASLSQEWINDLCGDQVPLGIHEDYYRLIREKATLRSVVKYCERQSKAAYEFGIGDDIETFLSKLEEGVMRFRHDKNARTGMKDGREVMAEMSESQRRTQDSPLAIRRGLMTGITEIDNHTSGLQDTETIVIAARPSCGKTALLLHLSLHAALRQKKPVGIFSLEMSAESLMNRAASMISGVGGMSVARGQVSKAEREEWLRAYEKVERGAITIDDSSDLTIDDIRARARRMVRDHGIRMIGIDYLQLIKHSEKDRFLSIDERIGIISNGCKQMGKELRLPVVLLAQLNRELEKRDDKKPRLSDLRNSGNIEQDADQVWAIHREHGIGSDAFDILSLKGRNTGIFDKVEMLFDGETQRLCAIKDSQPCLF
jgi:replicative DNA helicase